VKYTVTFNLFKAVSFSLCIKITLNCIFYWKMFQSIILLLFATTVGILAFPATSSWSCCWWTTSSSQSQPMQLTSHSTSFNQELRFDSRPQQFESHVQSLRAAFPTHEAPVVREGRGGSGSRSHRHEQESDFVSNTTSDGTTPDGVSVRSRSYRRVSERRSSSSYQNTRQTVSHPIAAPVAVTAGEVDNSYLRMFRCQILHC